MRVAYWQSIGLKWRIMETSNTFNGETLFDLTLFVGDTPASPSAPQASEQAKQMNGTFGPTSEMPLATFDPDTRSWKMCGAISLWEEQQLLENLPPSGMTRNGVLFPQPAWVPTTDATESSLWPTPTVDDSKNVYPKPNRIRGLVAAVNDSVAMWPTPRAGSMCGGTGSAGKIEDRYLDGTITSEERQAMRSGNGGKLNPEWVGWLMGFPPGWTDLED